MVVFLFLSGKKQISPLLPPPLEKFWKNPLVPPPGKSSSDAHDRNDVVISKSHMHAEIACSL